MAQQTHASAQRVNSPFFKIMNGIMKLVLRLPLRGGISKQLGLITVTGRKTGKTYTTPVGYLRVGNDHVHVFTHAGKWWKNLRGGAPVTIRMAGQDYHGTGIAIEDPTIIAEALYTYLSNVPGAARAYQVRTVDGMPLREDVIAQSPMTIMVDITLNTPSA